VIASTKTITVPLEVPAIEREVIVEAGFDVFELVQNSKHGHHLAQNGERGLGHEPFDHLK
jgi:hypothetical protein